MDVPSIVVGCLATVFALVRLDSQPLRLDEARTALIADAVLKSGIPRVRTDRPALFGSMEMAPNGLCVLHTPLQFYVAALGRWFSRSAGATRVPFAVIGAGGTWGAIALGNHFQPGAGAYVGLCFLQVPALLLIRQARYYPLVLAARVFALWSLVLGSWWLAALAGVVIRGSAPYPDGRTEFLAFVHHWSPLSGDNRLEEARRASRCGDAQPLPVIGGGDLNATASGKHLPQRDWMAATFSARTHKGILGPDGQWGPDTRALDYLIGTWDENNHKRQDGCGLHAIAEMAWQRDPSRPILPTVNDGVDAGGGLLIDWLLVNDAMKPHVIPDSYRVHIPDAGQPPPSDHRLVTVALDL